MREKQAETLFLVLCLMVTVTILSALLLELIDPSPRLAAPPLAQPIAQQPPR